MKSSILSISVFVFTLLIVKTSYSATCTAISSGNWSNPATWSCGTVPGCGDIIVIPAGFTVNVDTQVDLDENSSPACSTATFIQVSGTLQFITGFKISLACDSGVEIMDGGSMLPGGGGGMSNWLSICGIVVWKSGDGPVYGYEYYGDPIPLSIEFVDFSIDKVGEITTFQWIVKSERNNSFYEIEYSETGTKWIPFDVIPSIGDHTQNYIYTHEVNESCNTGYYKISVIDNDGVKTELKTVFYEEKRSNFSVYPNPIEQFQKLTIVYTASEEENLTLIVVDLLGKVVLSEQFSADKGLNNILISTNGLIPGLYSLRISEKNDFVAQKVVVK